MSLPWESSSYRLIRFSASKIATPVLRHWFAMTREGSLRHWFAMTREGSLRTGSQ